MVHSGEIIRCFLIGAYSLFIGIGIINLIVLVIKLATAKYALPVEVSGFNYGILTSTLSSLFDIAIGVMGLLGIVQNRKNLLKIIVCLLAFAIIMNIVILLPTIMTNKYYMLRSQKDALREKIMKRYGDLLDAESKEFTLSIDDKQQMMQCCGWSSDEAENLFTKTPWYRHVNANVTISDDKKINLPDSCCVEVGAKCTEAENLKAARKNKFVHEDDCLSSINRRASSEKLNKVLFAVCTFILQTTCIAATVMRILSPDEFSPEFLRMW